MRKEGENSSERLYLLLTLFGIIFIVLFFIGISINGKVINNFGSKIVGFKLFDFIRDLFFEGVMLGPAIAGDSVGLVIEGINCTGKTISFEYYEVDDNGNDLITGLYGLPARGIVSGDNVTATWLVQWFSDDDGDDGDTNPEIFFIASCDGSSATSDVLEILPAPVIKCTLDSECDDFNLCTTDTCSPSSPLANGFGCVFVNNSLPCDDGLYCNGADNCGGGTCSVHIGDPCDVSIENCFENSDSCNPKTCEDIDADGIPDYNIVYCNSSSATGADGGRLDFCTWTNRSYFEGNLSAINEYLPDTNISGLNISQINSSNLAEYENFVIEKQNIARIKFREKLMLVRINETGCFERINFSEKMMKIEDKKVFINSSYFSEMSRPAVIEFYGVSFTTPKMLKNGADCGSDCSVNYYVSGGNYSVNVTGFSTYEVVEGYVALTTTRSTSGSSTSGGTTSVVLCNQSIKCDSWEDCINGEQRRFCYDANACNKTQSYYEYKDCRVSVEGGGEIGEILGEISTPTTRTIGKIVLFVIGGIVIVGLVTLIVVYIIKRAKSGNKEVKMKQVLKESKKFWEISK